MMPCCNKFDAVRLILLSIYLYKQTVLNIVKGLSLLGIS